MRHQCGKNIFEYVENNNQKCQVKLPYLRHGSATSGAWCVLRGDISARAIARFHMTPEAERERYLADLLVRAKRKKLDFWAPINGRD